MRLVNHGLQFGVGEFQRIVTAHDLDQVGPAAHLFADGPAHLVRPAGLATTPVGVSASLNDRLTGDEQARAGENALFYRLLGEEIGLIHAQVAHQGDPRPQTLEHIGRRLVRADLWRIVHRLPGQVVNAVPGQVRVRVDQAGQEGLPAAIHDLGVGPSQVAGASHGDNLALSTAT